MPNLFTTQPHDTSSEANATQFMMHQMLMSKAFITLAVVTEVNETGDILTVKPMVEGFTGSGERIPKSEIYGVPVWRLQRGASAVIMPPVVDDIGLIAICDRDISSVKSTRESALPGSNRTHNYADAIYLGGVLNADPSQYVKFSNDGIDIVSPLLLSIEAPSIEANASSSFMVNSPSIVLNGQVSQGDGSFAGNFSIKGDMTALGEVTGKGVKLSTHVHGGVQSGGSSTQGPQ